jgi:hypothetical protein
MSAQNGRSRAHAARSQLTSSGVQIGGSARVLPDLSRYSM